MIAILHLVAAFFYELTQDKYLLTCEVKGTKERKKNKPQTDDN